MPLPIVQIGSDPLEDALLASVEVVQELNQHWWCTLAFRQTADLPIAVEQYLGKAVEISVSDDAGTSHILFAGFVFSVSRDSEVWGSRGAEIRAVSSSYLLDTTPRKQYYPESTLSSVAETIAGRTGLKLAVNAGSAKPLNYVQHDQTDFAFLHRIVDDYGGWMRPTATGLEVFTSFQTGVSVAWREERGLSAFSLRGRVAPATFSGSHYDFHVMQSGTFEKVSQSPEFFGSASALTDAVQAASAGLPPGFEPQRARAMSLDEYQAQLGAESERSMGSAVTCRGKSQNQVLTAGNTVQVTGTLDAAGTYGLVKVVHHWRPDGYENTFVGTPWKSYRHPEPPAMSLAAGLVPASVVGHDDPKKLGRLQVRYHWQEDNAAHWARMVTPHAGPDRGFMFMPELGDEVAVGFEDGDPERPVIMGSLWNGVQQAPREGYYGEADVAPNDMKRLVTKGGNRWHLADTLNREAMTLATPNHTYMTLSEQYSATGRPMLLLHSDGDIVFAAPGGRVHLQSAFQSRQVGEYVALPAAAPVDELAGMSCLQKMEYALHDSSGLSAMLAAVGGKKGLAILGGGAVVAGIIQCIPVAGEAEDVVAVIVGALAGLGLAIAGYNVVGGIKDLLHFRKICCGQAKTKADLKAAGQLGADALAKIGINAIMALLSAKPLAKGIEAAPRVFGEGLPEPLKIGPMEPATLTGISAVNSSGDIVSPQRILAGTNGKVAVIGRSMPGAVQPYANQLRSAGYDVNTFDGSNVPDSAQQDWDLRALKAPGGRIPDSEIPGTQMYQANQAWIDSMRSQGYTIVDVGNPMNNPNPSVFYNMEQNSVFGSLGK